MREDSPNGDVIDDHDRRVKSLHAKGVVGSVEWVSYENHEYTGLFKGAEYGVVRLSDAMFLFDDIEDNQMFSPSAAIKFFVSEHQSMNIMSQVSFDGIEDPYFFAEDMTTHMKRPENECISETMVKKFAEATMFPFQTGTGHLAAVDTAGNELADEE